MSFKIEYFDLLRIIEDAFNFDNFSATVIANYLDDCIDFDFDFTQYIWNTALFNVACIKGGKKEALQYIEDNLCCDADDCIIHECEEINGVYIEW